jgi:hypothetical protein
MKIRRTSNPDICFAATDAVALWCYGIVEFKVDTRKGKFVITPIMRDRSEGPIVDATEAYERFMQERRDGQAVER